MSPQSPAITLPGVTSTRSDLVEIARSRPYRRLLGTRLSSQLGDGFFQAGLASLVLFNAEQQATPLLVAGALSVTVLPFTVVGPFAGVLLDRWSRQRVLVGANPIRAVLATACAVGVLVAGSAVLDGGWLIAVYVLVLGALTVNRFLLAGLGASLPHTVAPELLVTANAVTPTAGTGVFAAGFAVGGLWRIAVGDGPVTDATLLGAAAAAWLVSAAVASRIPRDGLGPDEPTAASSAVAARAAIAGLREGAAHLWARPGPRNALAAMAAHRFAFGVLTIVSIVLVREYLTDDVAEAVRVITVVGAGAGVGALMAAVVTSPLVRILTTGTRSGLDVWLPACLVLAAVAVSVLTFGVTTWLLVVVGFVVAFGGQAVKICVDTWVQTGVDDAVRGRAFAFYDVAYNAAFVGAAAIAALVVPTDGNAPWLFAALAVWYLVAAGLYVLGRRR